MENTFLIITIVVIIDCILFAILLTQNLFTYELILIWMCIFSHILLSYAIFTNNTLLIDISHVLYVFWYIIGLTFSNIYILLLTVMLLIINVILWIIFGDCPMGKFESINETFLVYFFRNVIGINFNILYATIFAYLAKVYYVYKKKNILPEKIETIKEEENQEEV